MVYLNALNKSKKSYVDVDHELLIIGIFEGKELSPIQRSLDKLIGNKLSNAIALDKFNGKENKQLMIYGNESIKRIVLIGLGNQKNYTSNIARSVASNITRYTNSLNVSEFSVAGESFNLQKKGFK